MLKNVDGKELEKTIEAYQTKAQPINKRPIVSQQPEKSNS